MSHPLPSRPILSRGLTLSGASAGSYTVASSGFVRVQPSIDCWLKFGGAAVTPTIGVGGNSMPLTAIHGAEHFKVSAGEIISFIANDAAATGFISISEMSR